MANNLAEEKYCIECNGKIEEGFYMLCKHCRIKLHEINSRGNLRKCNFDMGDKKLCDNKIYGDKVYCTYHMNFKLVDYMEDSCDVCVENWDDHLCYNKCFNCFNLNYHNLIKFLRCGECNNFTDTHGSLCNSCSEKMNSPYYNNVHSIAAFERQIEELTRRRDELQRNLRLNETNS